MNNYINYLSLLYIIILICFAILNSVTQNKYIKQIFFPFLISFIIIFVLQLYYYEKYENETLVNLLFWKSPLLIILIFIGRYLFKTTSSRYGYFLDKAATFISLISLLLHLSSLFHL